MENSEHVYLRNVDTSRPGVLVANLLRPLQLAPDASMSLSSLNVSLSQGVTIETGELIGAAYGNTAGLATRFGLFIQPAVGTYTNAQFAAIIERALNVISVLYLNDPACPATNNLNRNALLGSTVWFVDQSTDNKTAYTIESVAGFIGNLATQANFTNLINCTATANGQLTASGGGRFFATYDKPLCPTGATWVTLPNNRLANGLTPSTIFTMSFFNGVDNVLSVDVIPDDATDGLYTLAVRSDGGAQINLGTVTSSAGHGIAVGFIRERGGFVIAWQDSSAYNVSVTGGVLRDTRRLSYASVPALSSRYGWRRNTVLEITGFATGTGAAAVIDNIWVTELPTRSGLGAVNTYSRAFAPGGLADELGFVSSGIAADGGSDYVDSSLTFNAASETLTSEIPTRNDAINGSLIITSDDIPASGRIADDTGSARERALIDFVTATSGLNGEATYEQAYPRHCYVKNRDVLSLQQMSIRLLDANGVDSDRVRPGGSAMLTFHNVVR